MSVSTASSSPTERKPIYSFHWASEVVSKALASHARAWEIVRPWIGLSERQLAFLLACNDPAWPGIRRIMQIAEAWETKQAKVGPIPMIWNSYSYKMLLRTSDISDEKLKNYLTSRLKTVD